MRGEGRNIDGWRVVLKGGTYLGCACCSEVGVKDEGYVGASIDVGVSKAGTRAWEGGVSGRGEWYVAWMPRLGLRCGSEWV